MENQKSFNFIEQIISEDLTSEKHQEIITRFPPEPNGYLHIGHAKSICLNFGLPKKFGGRCHLRFDDTNPEKEEQEYINSIQEDIKWLGFDWGEHLYFASDYFDQLFEWAKILIMNGVAYVDDFSSEKIREYRGTLTSPGIDSPFRKRSIEENLELFERMKNGEFQDGEKVLRAKIDMTSSNLNMRDPVLYRIKHVSHPRTGEKWCIYPMYDFTHGQSDAIENITHSICTMEFEDHRPLYEWFLQNLPVPSKPRQIEFARLNLSYTVMSKRKLLQLVQENIVDGWDDPRMPTISGMRRRGYTPAAIKAFADRIGVNRMYSLIDFALLEYFVRDDLNKKAIRVMAVLEPIKLIIDNYPDDTIEFLDAENNPEDINAGTRQIPFSKELYVEKNDFMEEAPPKYFRLSVGAEVRLKNAYFVRCTHVDKDNDANIVNVHCTYDPETKSGSGTANRKVKGTIHWVSVKHAQKAEVRLYDNLFTKENPSEFEEGTNWLDNINKESLNIITAFVEPSLQEASHSIAYQFIRNAYFCLDKKYSSKEKLIFNRIITLKDTWGKIVKNLSNPLGQEELS
jgi:glutaminyl-tRNA synthetase